MKKWQWILVINFVVLIILWLAADIIFTLNLSKLGFYIRPEWRTFSQLHQLSTYDDFRKTRTLRHSLVENTDKKPIMLFGCSFAYGYSLGDNQTFAYKLSKLTNRSVYNYSDNNLGIQYMPYIIDNYLDDSIQPEYIIYVLIEDHYNRLYRAIWGTTEPVVDARYELKKGELKVVRPKWKFRHIFPLERFFSHKLTYWLRQHSDDEKTIAFGNKHFELAQKIIKKKYPNAKIIIIPFVQRDFENSFYFRHKLDLNPDDFSVARTDDLVGRPLNHEEDFAIDHNHPSEHAWDLVTPALVKKFNM